MIKGYSEYLAVQMGIQLSDMPVVEGRDVGCLDVHLLKFHSGVHVSNTLVSSA
jgi:hypothetical protein